VEKYRSQSNTGIVSGTPARLMGWNIINSGATAIYIKFFDLAAADPIVLGTTPVVHTQAIGANSADIESESERALTSVPIGYFLKGIKYSVTSGIADSDTVVPGGAPLCQIYYLPTFGDPR
jgi:hypothetical protein